MNITVLFFLRTFGPCCSGSGSSTAFPGLDGRVRFGGGAMSLVRQPLRDDDIVNGKELKKHAYYVSTGKMPQLQVRAVI